MPRSVALIGGSEPASAQMLLVDLLLHSWRIVDNLLLWMREAPAPESAEAPLRQAQHVLASWGDRDPLCQWSLSAPPAPDS